MKRVIFIILLILLATNFASAEGEMTICTMDAMQCPDGSWVGRSGSNCEFNCSDIGIGHTESIVDCYGDDGLTDCMPSGLIVDPVLNPRPVLVEDCPNSYKPVCAVLPTPKCLIDNTCKILQPSPVTYSNDCIAKNKGAKILYEGKCDGDLRLEQLEFSKKTIQNNSRKEAPDNCLSWFDGCNHCGRATDDGSLVCTEMACQEHDEPRCLEYVEDLLSNGVNPAEEQISQIEKKEEYRVVQKTQTKKLFGIFKINFKTEMQLNENTGKIIKEKKPWYSFLLF